MTEPQTVTAERINERAVAYMAEWMAMTNPAEDQEQNWILGHLTTFAIRLHIDLLLALDAAQAETQDALRKNLQQSVADYRAESAEHSNTIKEFAEKDIALRKAEVDRDAAVARAEASEAEVSRICSMRGVRVRGRRVFAADGRHQRRLSRRRLENRNGKTSHA